MDKFFIGMLIFIPVTAVASYLDAPGTWLFVLAAVAIIPLAKFLSDATEELAKKTGPALGGLLNATFGNATELIIGLFALSSGLIELVKASIIGSILGNLLLVLGTAIFVGGLKHREQSFNRTAALANASVLLLAAIALVIPAIFALTSPGVSPVTIENLSLGVAILMMVSYGALLIFSLLTHKHLYVEEGVEDGRGWSTAKSVWVMVLATLAIAYLSNVLVSSVEPLLEGLGWTQLFLGVIVIAIIGNAGEHAAAVFIAHKNRMDLAMQISIGSATQILMFVAPVLVLAGAFMGQEMSLVFSSFELVALIFTVFIANSVTDDGESTWHEGLQLLIAYAIIGVAFFLHP